MIHDWSPLHLFPCIKPEPIEVCWSLLVDSKPLIVVEHSGCLGQDLGFRFRSGSRSRFDEGASLDFPVLETV
jgi:hypothetical protein